jgi:hypothetical protein
MIYKNSCECLDGCTISIIVEEKPLLVHCPAHISAYVLKLKEEKMRAMFLTKNITALIQPMAQGIIRASIAFYYGELLSGVMNSELQIVEFLELLTLKDVAYRVDLTWRKVAPTARKSVLEKLSQKTRS